MGRRYSSCPCVWRTVQFWRAYGANAAVMLPWNPFKHDVSWNAQGAQLPAWRKGRGLLGSPPVDKRSTWWGKWPQLRPLPSHSQPPPLRFQWILPPYDQETLHDCADERSGRSSGSHSVKARRKVSHCPNLTSSPDEFNFLFCFSEALGLVLSALYGKLLVVMGIAFPMSEVISTYIPPSFYDVRVSHLILIMLIIASAPALLL